MSSPRDVDTPVVIASNRGPVSYRRHAGVLTAVRGGGGLVSGLAPLLDSGRATWIATALSDDDRAAAAASLPAEDGLAVHLLDIPVDEFEAFYDVVANSYLWFVHHGLFDSTHTPSFTDEWHDAWGAYRRVNAAFAHAVCEHAPADSVVLVQDYHLTLLAPIVAAERGDLRLVHFHHTPFAGPDGLRILEPAARNELLRGLAAHHACGFHIPTWGHNFAHSQQRWGPPDSTRVFASSLSSDLDYLQRVATSPECDAALAALDERVGDRVVVARVDRMELSKNVVRGFHAFDHLLEHHPDLRGRVVFVAHCYPSRLGVPAYRAYHDEVMITVERVNERWGTGDWQPVLMSDDDDFAASVATFRRYDVLLVNPVRDGLNLVAKEGPAVNERDGQLVLSTEAGVHAELEGAADSIHPFDIVATSRAIAAAISRSEGERRARAEALRRDATARTPADWLTDQLAAAAD